MRKILITFLTFILLLMSFAACGKTKTEVEKKETPITEKTDSVKLESVLGKWQTEDGNFTYELFEDGTLVTGSKKGEDLCLWSLEGDAVIFDFTDSASIGYKYNADEDILENSDVPDSNLIRKDTENGMPDTIYEAGKEYVLQEDMKVRERPSAESAWKKTADLADEDKDKALEGDDAVLAKGSVVKCRGAYKNWILTGSGWICGSENGQYYIIDTEAVKMMEEQRNRYFEKIGIDPESRIRLTGNYTIKGDNSADSVELFEDGDCIVHYKEPAVPVTDEEGYTNGYYAVKGDKVYITCGGSVYAEAYSMFGKKLNYLNERINWIAD